MRYITNKRFFCSEDQLSDDVKERLENLKKKLKLSEYAQKAEDKSSKNEEDNATEEENSDEDFKEPEEQPSEEIWS